MRLWGLMTAKEIAPHLPGRSVKSVLNRIQYMRDNAMQDPEVKVRFFTPKEDEFIRKQHATMSCADIGRELQRTAISIMRRGHKIWVHFAKFGDHHHSTRYSDALVREIQVLREVGSLPFHAIGEKTGITEKLAQKLYSRRFTQEDRVHEYMLPR